EVSDDTPRYVHGMSRETFESFQQYHDATLPEVERRLGAFRAHRIQLANHSLFPNGILGFRLAHPRGPMKTEFWHFVLLERDAPGDAHQRPDRARDDRAAAGPVDGLDAGLHPRGVAPGRAEVHGMARSLHRGRALLHAPPKERAAPGVGSGADAARRLGRDRR